MTDFSKILDKAKELESKMKESQEKIKNITADGTSGSNSVSIVLNGDEVKSLRQGKVSINEAFAETENGELWLINANISSYKNAAKVYISDEKRKRKLLLKKKDISTFQGKVEREGYTIVPIKIYFNKKGIAKVEIAVAKGKKHDGKRNPYR